MCCLDVSYDEEFASDESYCIGSDNEILKWYPCELLDDTKCSSVTLDELGLQRNFGMKMDEHFTRDTESIQLKALPVERNRSEDDTKNISATRLRPIGHVHLKHPQRDRGHKLGSPSTTV